MNTPPSKATSLGASPIRRGYTLVELVVVVLMCSAGGCLSLGGRTTYVQASPEVEARIRGLETRVGALEQAVTTRAAPPPLHESGLPIIGQANSPPPHESADQSARDAAVR